MLTTAFLSLWISNVAATSMMLPIVEAVAKQLIKNNKQYRYRHTSISGDPFEKREQLFSLPLQQHLAILVSFGFTYI
jgi:di/tricarboxylate transporter